MNESTTTRQEFYGSVEIGTLTTETARQEFYGPVTIVQPADRPCVSVAMAFAILGRTSDGRTIVTTGQTVALEQARGGIMAVLKTNQRVSLTIKAPLDDRGAQTKVKLDVSSSNENVIQIGNPPDGSAVAEWTFHCEAAHAVPGSGEEPELGSAVVTLDVKQEDGDDLQTLTFAYDVVAQDALTVTVTEGPVEDVPLP